MILRGCAEKFESHEPLDRETEFSFARVLEFHNLLDGNFLPTFQIYQQDPNLKPDWRIPPLEMSWRSPHTNFGIGTFPYVQPLTKGYEVRMYREPQTKNQLFHRRAIADPL